jgi:hypothetical protein
MKKFIFLYILASFIAIGLFGFVGLLDYHSGFADCASSLTNTKMPPCDGEGSLAMGLSHAEIYRNFSLAIIVLSALLFVVALILIRSFFEVAPSAFVHNINRYLDDFMPASQQKVIRWFNLLQHSDPRLNF